MKIKASIFIICIPLILFTINSCTERELFDDNFILPSVTGLYTEISGNVSGKLTKEKSPYLITKDLIVETGDSLIIEPGVVLFFNERCKFLIKGYIKAEGTRTQRIYFTFYKGSWNGLSFNSSVDGSKLKFCIIEEINKIVESTLEKSGLDFVNAYCQIQNTIFRKNSNDYSHFISCTNSSILISNCILTDNTAKNSVINAINSRIRLINNVFYNNQSREEEPIIFIKRSLNTEIQNNIFYKNKSKEEIKTSESDTNKIIIDYNFFGSNSNDPQFWNYENFRLYYTSPCIDAGNPSPEFNDLNGTRNDQGAYGGPDGNW